MNKEKVDRENPCSKWVREKRGGNPRREKVEEMKFQELGSVAKVIFTCSLLVTGVLFSNIHSHPRASFARRLEFSHEAVLHTDYREFEPADQILSDNKDFNETVVVNDLVVPVNAEELRYQAWLQTQEQRRTRVKEVCAELQIDKHLAHLTEPTERINNFLKNIIVDEKHKVLYCIIPKAACTSWKSMLLGLTGDFDLKHPEKYRKQVHQVGRLEAHGLRRLSSVRFPSSTKMDYLANYTKFVNVRHPWRRLKSAFENKFRQFDAGALPFHRNYGRAIIRRYRTNPTEESLRTGENITMEEFLRFVAADHSTNAHWMSFQRLCHPCYIHYDYIGTVETLEEDSNYILEKVFHTDYRLQNLQATNRTKQNPFQSIPESIIRKLDHLYSADFEMFGYTQT